MRYSFSHLVLLLSALTCTQADALDRMLNELGRSLTCVIYIKASEEVIVRRLTGRRVCEKCGRIYNIPNRPPKADGKCTVCDGMVVQRKDDLIETVKNRIKVYEEQTAEVVDYYAAKKILCEVSGDVDARETRSEIERKLERDVSGSR